MGVAGNTAWTAGWIERKNQMSRYVALVDAIDQVAVARGLTRSAFLATAAREKIADEG